MLPWFQGCLAFTEEEAYVNLICNAKWKYIFSKRNLFFMNKQNNLVWNKQLEDQINSSDSKVYNSSNIQA